MVAIVKIKYFTERVHSIQHLKEREIDAKYPVLEEDSYGLIVAGKGKLRDAQTIRDRIAKNGRYCGNLAYCTVFDLSEASAETEAQNAENIDLRDKAKKALAREVQKALDLVHFGSEIELRDALVCLENWRPLEGLELLFGDDSKATA